MIILFWTLFAVTLICFIACMVCIVILFNNQVKLSKAIRENIQDDALLHYRMNALIREIDFHLHGGSDELATSYFANCKEYRDKKGTSYSSLFDIWKGK